MEIYPLGDQGLPTVIMPLQDLCDILYIMEKGSPETLAALIAQLKLQISEKGYEIVQNDTKTAETESV